jgi:hypothetical protein
MENSDEENYIENNEAEMIPEDYGPEIYMEYDEEEIIIEDEGTEHEIAGEYSDENAQIVVERFILYKSQK